MKALGRLNVRIDGSAVPTRDVGVGTEVVEEPEEKDEWVGTSGNAGRLDEMEVDEEREPARDTVKESEDESEDSESEEEKEKRKVDYKNSVETL
jgi:hypothetical protein